MANSVRGTESKSPLLPSRSIFLPPSPAIQTHTHTPSTTQKHDHRPNNNTETKPKPKAARAGRTRQLDSNVEERAARDRRPGLAGGERRRPAARLEQRERRAVALVAEQVAHVVGGRLWMGGGGVRCWRCGWGGSGAFRRRRGRPQPIKYNRSQSKSTSQNKSSRRPNPTPTTLNPLPPPSMPPTILIPHTPAYTACRSAARPTRAAARGRRARGRRAAARRGARAGRCLFFRFRIKFK